MSTLLRSLASVLRHPGSIALMCLVCGMLAWSVDIVSLSPVGSATVYAEAPGKITPPTQDNGAENASAVMNGLIQGIFMLASPIIMLCNWLLTPDWTYGEAFGMRSVLYSLWIMVSNVVYVIFAIFLVVIAIMNVFGKWGYELKAALPNFIVGIILVPLSWFIVSLTLSVTNILTASIMGIPMDMVNSGTIDRGIFDMIQIPQYCTINLENLGGSGSTANKIGGISYPASCDDKHMISLTTLLNGNGAYSLLNYYAYGIFKIQNAQKINPNNLSSISGIADIITHLSLSFLFGLVFIILMIALLFGLFTRACYLWVMIIFSPVFGLIYFANGKFKTDKLKESFGIETFLSLAMVPVYVAAALVFGMLFTALTMNGNMGSSWSHRSYVTSVGNGTSQTLKFGEGNTALFLSINGVPIGTDENGNPMSLGFSWLGKIILNILALGILWMGVMGALSSSKITEGAVKPFQQFGKTIIDLAKTAPQYMPILPGGLSAQGLQSLGSKVSGDITTKYGSGTSSALQQSLNEKFNLGGSVTSQAQTNASNLPSPTGSSSEQQAAFFQGRLGNVLKNMNDSTQIDAMKDALTKTINADTFLPEDRRKQLVEEIGKATNGDGLAKVLADLNTSLNNKLFNGRIITDPTTIKQEAAKWAPATARGTTSTSSQQSQQQSPSALPMPPGAIHGPTPWAAPAPASPPPPGTTPPTP